MQHILENDMYKFTMQQGVITLFPSAYARFEFFNRGGTQFPPMLGEAVHNAIQSFGDISLQADDIAWLRENCPFLSPAYLSFLKGFRFDPTEVKIGQHDGDLRIEIEGPWFSAMMWEVPLMATISEEYFRRTHRYPFGGRAPNDEWVKVRDRNQEKLEKIKKFLLLVADFGLRRRYSAFIQGMMLDTLGPALVGTSNVYEAMKRNMKPIGTHAHEWFQFHAVRYGYRYANHMALENWAKVYQGNLGIALTDTFTTDVFFRDFGMFPAKLFDGVRHDSGDPYVFAAKMAEHYQSLGIDPTSKTIVFSDSLTIDKAIDINTFCKEIPIKASFGIGTHLTNDVDVTPLNMVIKMTGVRRQDGKWVNAIKLSDDKGKNTGDPKEIELCKGMLA